VIKGIPEAYFEVLLFLIDRKARAY
jgi:hypothetical protein